MAENLEKLRLLLIDDEEGMRLGIARALRDFTVTAPQLDGTLQFELFNAANGETGLEMIREHRPHIILLDNKLPGISGIEMLKLISEMDIDAVTVMITAYASIETAVKAMKYGAYDFLPKPFTPDELKYSVRKAANHIALTIQARNLTEERRQVRFQFISVLAHELKSPINAIESYLNLIRDRSAGDDPQAYEKMLSRSLTRLEYMKKLIADLLDMTRIESGKRVRNIQPLQLGKIAETVFDSYRESADERGIQLEFEAEVDSPFAGDESEIEIILNNLISNSIKYNRDNGTVRLQVYESEEFMHIDISDSGIGLTEEEIGKLFNDFVRIKKEETKKILGSGLGLSTVKKIVQLYEGSIEVTSEVGKGSTFSVELRKTEANGGEEDE